MPSLRSALLSAALALPAGPAWVQEAGPAIEVHDAYAIASRPGAPSGAAFMVVHNHGDAPDRLIGASSPAAERAELHAHVEDAGGVMRMVEVEDGFALPPGGELAMERGGAHIMLLGLGDAFADGATIPLTLEFEGAGAVVVDVPVDLGRLGGDAHAGHGT